MRKNNLNIYQLTIILSGIGIPVFIAFKSGFLLPPIHNYIVFFAVVLISSFLGMVIRGTMISFDIAMYYFLLLMFGPVTASLTAILTELVIWSNRAISGFKTEGRSYLFKTLRLGFYNAGVYGLLYMIVGIIYLSLWRINELIAMVVGILLLVFLNEIFFSIYTVLSGEHYLKYLKTEGLKTDLLEFGIYPFGISMYFLYNSYGFIHMLPFIIGILLLSILGKVMSDYQDKLTRSLEDISRLNKISRILSSILQLDTLLGTILKETHNILKPEECSIYIKSVYDKKEYFYTYDGNVIKRRNPNEFKGDPGSLMVPLESGNRELGFIKLGTERKLGDDEIALIQNIAEQASVSLSNAMLYMISIRDPLTDLYTRRHFEARLKEEVSRSDRANQSFSLIMFDVNELKKINDTYGHKTGDEVLKSFAKTLRNCSRPFDVSARWGGDEFILILPKTSEKQAIGIRERISKKFSGTMIIGDSEVSIACSCAVVEYESGSGLGAEEIFYKVDQKLIEVKKKTI